MKPTRRAVPGQPGLPSLGWSQMVSPCLLAFRLAARRRPCRAFPNGSGRCNSAMNLVDVAERAKVSTATVSRVLNDIAPVRVSTRERVMKAVRELHYHPNMNARNLAKSFLFPRSPLAIRFFSEKKALLFEKRSKNFLSIFRHIPEHGDQPVQRRRD